MVEMFSKENVRVFLHKQIMKARQNGDEARVDELLEKLHNLDDTFTFIEMVCT